MLIQFTVGNYRSIREEQTLSMVAGNDDALPENLIPVVSLKWPLLRQVAIYGPNASGKSNLLRAIETLRVMIEESAGLQEGQSLSWLQPHRLDKLTEQQPVTFTLIFQLDGVRHQYDVEATTQRIVHEELTVWPQGRPQRWFSRTFDADSQQEKWIFGSNFKGDRHQRHLWQTSTRSNALFLSTAVLLNNDQLKVIFHWITEKLIVVLPGATVLNVRQWKNLGSSLERLKSTEGHERMMAVLRAADVGIERLFLKENSEESPKVLGLLDSLKAIANLMIDPESVFLDKVGTVHKRADGSEVQFDFMDESDGTRKLFEFAGVWLLALETGATLLVDEIDRSLHSLLARMLVKLFRNYNNPHNAQLVFTTHDTTLLDTDLLRRDQIWFVEKDKRGATQLFSLLEFSPRKNEAVERGYLVGRYGAVPFVREPRWQDA
jgi:hypothetical protein